MSTGATQVQRDAAGRLATCSCCGMALRQVDGFDPDVALGTLLQHHPQSPGAVHRPAVPAGWRIIDLTVPA
jgi:hypothetical protein